MWAKNKQSGFTIVELLIVVVVIAILAAITIVSYNGIQSRAKAAQYASDASTIAKKAEVFYADPATGNAYPTTGGSFPTDPASVSALPAGIAVIFTNTAAVNAMSNNVITSTSAPGSLPSNPLHINSNTNLKTYTVRACAGTGLQIFYPDPTGTTAKNIIVGSGC